MMRSGTERLCKPVTPGGWLFAGGDGCSLGVKKTGGEENHHQGKTPWTEVSLSEPPNVTFRVKNDMRTIKMNSPEFSLKRQ